MIYSLVALDQEIDDAQRSLNAALRVAEECDPSTWDELREYIQAIEEAKDLLNIPEAVEQAIMEAHESLDSEFEDDFDDQFSGKDPEWR